MFIRPKKQTNKNKQNKKSTIEIFVSKENCFECCNDDLTSFLGISAARTMCHIFFFSAVRLRKELKLYQAAPAYYYLYCYISDIDYCLNVTCKNAGSCVDGIKNFTCSCQIGYTGDLCETGKESAK